VKAWSLTVAALLVGAVTSTTLHAQPDQLYVAQASYGIHAFALANDVPEQDNKSSEDSAVGFGGSSARVGDQIGAVSNYSTGVATASANATIGGAGVSLFLAAESKLELPFAGLASAAGFAAASWHDRSIVQSSEAIPGQRIIMRSMVIPHFETFDFQGKTVGDDSRATLNLYINDFTEDRAMPDSPYGGNLWGSISSAPNFGTNIEYPPAAILLDHEMIVGAPYTMGLGLKLEGDVHPDLPGSAEASANFSHTLKWGGILSVRDAATGRELTDWTITSESGFDYSRSFDEQVPEPSALGLLLSVATVAMLCRQAAAHRTSV